MEQGNCFWLTDNRDTLYLFDDSEIIPFESALTRSEMLRVKNFAKGLKPSYRTCMEDIELMKEILRKMETGDLYTHTLTHTYTNVHSVL